MRVYIGPYRHRWISSVHEHYMNWKYGKWEWEDNQNLFERLLEKLEDALQNVYDKTINKILDNRSSQKIKVRIDDHDIWSMDDTLSHIIYPMLKLLQESKHGTPAVDQADVPKELRTRKRTTKGDPLVYDKTENLEKQWAWVLGEIVWAFEQKSRVDGWETDYHKEGDWDSEHWEKINAHHNRMDNGFRLFGKYYECLWT